MHSLMNDISLGKIHIWTNKAFHEMLAVVSHSIPSQERASRDAKKLRSSLRHESAGRLIIIAFRKYYTYRMKTD